MLNASIIIRFYLSGFIQQQYFNFRRWPDQQYLVEMMLTYHHLLS